MNKNNLEIRLGIFFLLVLIVVVIMMELIGALGPLKPGIRIQTQFNNVLDLKKGDPVKVAGVAVGAVESIKLKNGAVLVTMVIDRDTGITTESPTTIKFLGMMGQNYVNIDFSTNGLPVQDGAMLQSIEQPDISQLMSKLDGVITGIDDLTRNFSSDGLDNLMGPITDFLSEHKDSLNSIGPILVNLENITSAIAEGNGTMGKIIHDEAIYTSAMGTLTNLETTIGDMKDISTQAKTMMADVQQGKGTVGKLVSDDSAYMELKDMMTNLKEIMQKVNKGQGTAGKIVNDESLYKNAKLTMQKLDKASEGLEDQGPISVIGIAAGSLF